MAGNSSDDEYAAQWSDNLSFSKESIQESQKRVTQQLAASAPTDAKASVSAHTQPFPPTGPLPRNRGSRRLPPGESGELQAYVSEMNQEVGRVTNLVGSRMDNLGDSISGFFSRMGQSLSGMVNAGIDTIQNSLHNVTKAIARECSVAVRTVINGIMGTPTERPTPPPSRSYQPPAPIEQPHYAPQPPPLPAQPAERLESPQPAPQRSPAFKISFTTLIEKGVFFKTIQDRPFLDESDLKFHVVGDPQAERLLIDKAIAEIHNCASFGRKLPSPGKGPFAGMAMFDILAQVDYESMQRFLTFVSNRSRPFQEKSLRLSEAYATWAHKGAPER